MQEAVVFSQDRPVLIDRFLEEATEVDVDALADSHGEVLIAGIMEHIEEAGVHSGDSSCVLPSTSLAPETLAVIRSYTGRLARALNVIGLMNVQYAVKDGTVYGHRSAAAQDRGGLDARQAHFGIHGRARRVDGPAILRKIAGISVQ
jgi:carbamoylphosphate synthase large subunit